MIKNHSKIIGVASNLVQIAQSVSNLKKTSASQDVTEEDILLRK